MVYLTRKQVVINFGGFASINLWDKSAKLEIRMVHMVNGTQVHRVHRPLGKWISRPLRNSCSSGNQP